jgi:uncharacterized protein (DUF4415 family)
MKKNYDFSNAVKNPYIKKLKRQITIRMESDVVDYFKTLSIKEDIPYQKLINIYLRDCAIHQKRPVIHWDSLHRKAA